MPSDEMVEKVKNAIRDAVGCHTTTGRPGVGCMTMDVPELCSCWVAAKAALAAAEAGEPVAWMDDGTLRAGSEATAHRVVTDATKRGMPRAAAESFTVPLFASPPSEASRDERAEHMLEELEKRLQRRLADLRDSDAVRHADIIVRKEFSALATAIRARGEA